jgi:CHAD domain-containing protein
VPPLAATVAATVAVGVGMAVARASRGRSEQERTEEEADRQFELLPGEQLGEGIRRMALGQVDMAVALLGAGGAKPDEHAVHETRKALKRLRALVRLLERELGAEPYRRESAALREIAAGLAAARDSEVMLATLEALLERSPRRLRRRAGVKRLRRRLTAERDRLKGQMLADEASMARLRGDLRAFRARVLAWPLRERGGGLVEPGLADIYRQGRRRYRRTLVGKGDRTVAMHQWRKRVKDLRYAAEMLQRRDPWNRSANGRRGGGRADTRRLRRLAKRADVLGETLGEDHDLALLAELLRGEAKRRGKRSKRAAAPLGRRSRRLLLKQIARRRRKLRGRALRRGERLYRRRTKRFMRRTRSAYADGPLS